MIYFTSDTHFGHANIVRMGHRPFESIEHMDQSLIDNINDTVLENDILYHLGDFSFKNVKKYRDQINCKKVFLIWGNHDKQNKKGYLESFVACGNLEEIKYNDVKIVLCHYAMKIWNKSHYGAWHLYGHSHGTMEDDPNRLSIDVGVDAVAKRLGGGPEDYRPLSFYEVKAIMDKKEWKPVDRHGADE